MRRISISKPARQRTGPPRWGVIADDLTGATDTAAAFVRAGFAAEVLLETRRPRRSTAQVIVVSTDSRHDPPREARRKVAAVCRWFRKCGARVIYKKLDSTLQGNIAVEVETIRDAAGFKGALLCSANPAQGRLIRGGRLVVRGEGQGNVAERLTAQGLTVFETLHGPLSTRGQALERTLARAPFVIADAVSKRDLSVLAHAALRARVLPAGSAGLAAEFAELLARSRSTARRRSSTMIASLGDRPILILCGSLNPVTRRQLRRLRASTDTVEMSLADRAAGRIRQAVQRNRNVILRVPVHRRSDAEVLQRLRSLTPLLVEQRIGGCVLTGGDTTLLVCRWLRPQGISIAGEIVPGLAWGRWIGGVGDGLPVCTKPGGFGGPDSLAQAVQRLRGR